MNYRVVAEFSINNEDSDNEGKEMPLSQEIITSVYEGRLVPEGLVFDIKTLTCEVY